MYCLSNMCFICLNNEDPVSYIILQHAENEIVQQVKFILPEITILEPWLPLPICSTCREILSAFHNFKKICLENNCRYNDYINKLQGSNSYSKREFGELEVTINEINLLPNIEEKRNTHLNTQDLEAEENSLGVEIDIKEDFTEEYSTLEDSIDPSYQKIVKEETGFINLPGCDQNINCVDQKLVKAQIQFSDQEVRIGKNKLFSNLNEEENIISITEKREDNIDPLFSEQCRSSEQGIVRETVQCQVNDFKCPSCNEMFEQETFLENHMIVHASVNETKCLICNKIFTHIRSIRWHMKAHARMKNYKCINEYKCAICNNMFKQKSSLQRHMTIHTGVKNYKCSICNKMCIYSSNFKNHMKIHTGEKNYKCAICNKMFRQSSTLKDHMMIHTGEKKYKCSLCNTMFRHSSTLKCHMMIHTGMKNYKCSICNKLFSQNAYLKRHMTIHSGIKSYKCSICNKMFGRKSILKRHRTIH